MIIIIHFGKFVLSTVLNAELKLLYKIRTNIKYTFSLI
jgi:hypothetical protein